jgi:hypothetical protein
MSNDESGRQVEVDVEPLTSASRTINAMVVRSMDSVEGTLSVQELRVKGILSRVGQA